MLPNGYKQDLRKKQLSSVQKCHFYGSEWTPRKVALLSWCSFFDPILEIIFETNCPDNRFARSPAYSTAANCCPLKVPKQLCPWVPMLGLRNHWVACILLWCDTKLEYSVGNCRTSAAGIWNFCRIEEFNLELFTKARRKNKPRTRPA